MSRYYYYDNKSDKISTQQIDNFKFEYFENKILPAVSKALKNFVEKLENDRIAYSYQDFEDCKSTIILSQDIDFTKTNLIYLKAAVSLYSTNKAVLILREFFNRKTFIHKIDIVAASHIFMSQSIKLNLKEIKNFSLFSK